MGTIARFNILELANRFGFFHFVETGTGSGNGTAYASLHNEGNVFRTIRSCEIEISLVAKAREQFKNDPRVHIFAEQSDIFLKWVCDVLPYDEPILFWLDAHFPGADYGIRGYDFTKDRDIRLPLEHELSIIARRRPQGRDVVVCDDLRIYKDGPFAHNNVPAGLRGLCPKERGIRFVHRIMGETHDIEELYEHEGYLLLTPKG